MTGDGSGGTLQTETDPLLDPWPGPFGGVPPWDRVDPDRFLPAFEAAIADAKAEIEAIAAAAEPPTVANTIDALESSGRMLDRLRATFGVHTANLNTGPIPEIQRTVGPMLAGFSDWVTQHPTLFARVREVHAQIESGAITVPDDTRRVVVDRFRGFVRNGAELDDDAAARLSEINQTLAGLYTDFTQNVLHDEAELVTWVEDRDRLDGLPASLIDGLAAAAAERGRPDAFAILNTRSFMEPVLTNATDRALREQVWRTYYSRGDNPGPHDNKPIITRILSLRAERARLLGYRTHAHWRLEVAMAKTPEAAMDLMLEVWPKARDRARQEVADMEALAGTSIEPWDYRFWAERVRMADYDLDFNDVKPYLQLDSLIEAMLWCSTELYGLDYRPLDPEEGVPGFHPDVRVWEVTGPGDVHVGLWYLDPYAREGKLSGAWMTAYRAQENLDGPVSTLVSNNSNFVKGAPGEPILVSWDDARTLFHEFGHALHGLLSDVRYPSQSGTAVSRDYVEFPSQINEHWLPTPEVLNRFCRHYQTGEPMPAELIERIKRAETFNQGFDTVEYLSAAIVDMRLHLAAAEDPTGEIDPDRFERELLAELDMPAQIVMRHRTPQFAHVFSGDGYSAGYYSYLWADALTADAAEAFTEAGGYFDAEVAERLRDHVFSAGDTVDPADGFRAFRGRDVDTDALLRKRGFPVG
ncbi:MAG: M3 family metallopeptidase [Actinomycetota bacterium]